MVAFLIVFAVILILYIVNFFLKLSFVKQFNKGNVLVSGMRGRGKDVAFCIVVNTRKRNYICNIQYSNPKKRYQRFDFDAKVWALSGNTYTDLIDNKVKTYSYPYPDCIDYYISDAGIYFPSQYQNELVKRYSGAPMFQALSRHLGDCNVHVNSQRQNRVWDKIREQSDIYIVMRGCHVLKYSKFALIRYTIYSNEESAEAQLKLPFFGLGKRSRELKQSFLASHGSIKNGFFFARIPYRFDSRRFKKILENNLEDYENE